jgi:hypothetical protein
MILSSDETLSAISKILTEDLLPRMEKASWEASSIRACLALLSYAQDAAQEERALLLQTNEAMRELFNGLARALYPTWLGDTLRASVAQVVRDATLPDTASTVDLQAENERHKALLSEIISRAALARRADPEIDAEFRAALHRCLAVLAAKDAEITRRSRLMLPL